MEKKIFNKIKKYDFIVIARHIGPDPDAICSQLALRDSIKLTFPNKKVVAVGASVSRFKNFGTLDKLNDINYDNALLIVVDVPNLARIDGVNYQDYKEIIKIDHHPLLDKIGEVELIDETASSACELLAQIMFNTKLKIDQKIAENLYIGMVSDSDRFLFSTTTSRTFDIASKLVKDYNLDITKLYNTLYERPLNEFKFQAFLTLNMTITENGFGYIKLNNEMLKEYSVDSSTASNLVNNFNYIKEYLAWAFISYDERLELYKVNIRSRGPIINEIAAKYNGGGHKYASGARITNVDEVDNLIKELDEACKEYRESINLGSNT